VSVPAARAERLLDRLLARGLDALLVTTLVDVRYLTGFTGTAGGALLRADGSGLFLTDFRYQEQSAAQVGAPWEIAVVDDLPRALAETLGAAGRLGPRRHRKRCRDEQRDQSGHDNANVTFHRSPCDAVTAPLILSK